MANQVSARLKGDDYQARFFWCKAAEMLYDDTVEKVTLEHDKVSIVDDVGVYYDGRGTLDKGKYLIKADFFQIKYHVTFGGAFSSTAIIEPGFIHTKKSLLLRMYEDYLKLRKSVGQEIRLHVVSNWAWDHKDPLAKVIEGDGSLREDFFEASVRRKLGKIRKKCMEHLGIGDKEFREFAVTLRFGCGYLSISNLRDQLNARLVSANLTPVPRSQDCSPYDDLARKFIESNQKKFNKETLLAICRREGLVEDNKHSKRTVLGIRSFQRFAERLEAECDLFIELCDLFEERYAKSDSFWNKEIPERLAQTLNGKVLDGIQQPIEIALDTHLSIAFYAGYLLDPKSGIAVVARQKIRGEGIKVWEPSGKEEKGDLWTSSLEPIGKGDELAVAVSVTHLIHKDVRSFFDTSNQKVSHLLTLEPANAAGAKAVEDGSHAWQLAEQFQRIVQTNVQDISATSVHIFMAAPIALAFLMGQLSRVFGTYTLYEWDFDRQRIKGGGYFPSISVPIISMDD